MQASDLYLDLLKRVLTDTLFAGEPDVNAPPERFLVDFVRHYIRGPALSMLPIARLDNLQACIADVVARGVAGDLIEAGVWRGGAAIFMRAVLRALAVEDRTVWVADSFEGLPVPDAARFPREAAAHRGSVATEAFRHFAVPIETVRENFRRFGLLDGQVRFLEGWFADTLPVAPIERLAVLRLDADYFQSTMDGLVHLYDRLSVGGYVIVDDYGETEWTYCREAVDAFRAERAITEPLIAVDRRCSYWQRAR